MMHRSQGPRRTGSFLAGCAAVLCLHADVGAQINITSQPQPVTTTAGRPATFGVVASGPGLLTYAWRRNTVPIPGATQATYAIPSVSQSDAGLYSVRISAGSASATSEGAALAVDLPEYPGAVEPDLARSITLESEIAGDFSALEANPDGSFYVVGPFRSVNGTTHRSLARINADGTHDLRFAAPEFDYAPSAISVQADGKVLAAGEFSTVGSDRITGIVRLNANGSRDQTFFTGSGFNLGASSVRAVAGGAIYVTGRLGRYANGGANFDDIVRLTANGTVDSAFAAPRFGGVLPIFPRFDISRSGVVYARGDFTTVNGVARARLVRLLASGSVDPAFDPGLGPNGAVYVLVSLPNGQIVIGGNFTSYNGTSVGRIARINPNGTLDTSFATGSGFSGDVFEITEVAGNELVVVSLGQTFNGQAIPNGVVKLTASGGRSPGFNWALSSYPRGLILLPNGSFAARGYFGEFGLTGRQHLRVVQSTGAPSPLETPAFRFSERTTFIEHLPNGRLLLGGHFTHVNGQPARFVVRLNADLSLDTTFSNGAASLYGASTGALQPDGKLLLVTSNGMTRLNTDGSRDSSFTGQSPPGSWHTCPPVVLPDGRIFLPTRISTWAGTPVTNGFVMLAANGALLSSHSFLPGPPSGSTIQSARLLPDGSLMVTGSFSSWNGIPRPRAVRLRADGSVDTLFVPDPSLAAGNDVPLLAPHGPAWQRDGRVILMTGGGNPGLVRLAADGVRDRSYAGVLPATYSIGEKFFFIQPDDRVVFSSDSNVASVTSRLRPDPIFVRLTAGGSADVSFSFRDSESWQSALLSDNGDLLSADGRGYLFRSRRQPPPVIRSVSADVTIAAGSIPTFFVDAIGTTPLTYQWAKDGVAIPGATKFFYSIVNVSSSAAGSYTVTVTGPSGTVVSTPRLLTITPRPLPGYYFGSIGTGNGDFGLLVRADGTGSLVAYSRSPRTALAARRFVVSADRTVRFRADGAASNGAETQHEVAGTFSIDGVFSGTAGSIDTLTSASPVTTGAADSYAGWYEGGAAGRTDATYLLLGPAGTVVAASLGVSGSAGGAGLIAPTGELDLSDDDAARLHIQVDPSSKLFTAVRTPATGPAMTYAGENVDKRTDSEKLLNLSARGRVQGNAVTFSAGFVIGGEQPKNVLIRAVGPTLARFQVAGALPAARLEVFRGPTLLVSGGDWGASSGDAVIIGQTATSVGAFALPPDSRDAALLLRLDPGAYSAKVAGADGASGVALVEIYDATDAGAPRTQRLVNLSTLAPAGIGENTLTAGFFIGGSVPKRVLVRGAGPALSQFGIADALARPRIELVSGATTLAQNAGWSTSAGATAITKAALEAGAFVFPVGSADAALLLYLAPGSYTAQVTGVGGATGTALVEIYELP